MRQISAAKSMLCSLIEAPLESRDVVAAHWLSKWLWNCKEMYISERVIVVCHNQYLFVGFIFLTKQLFEVFGTKSYLNLRGVLCSRAPLPPAAHCSHGPLRGLEPETLWIPAQTELLPSCFSIKVRFQFFSHQEQKKCRCTLINSL